MYYAALRDSRLPFAKALLEVGHRVDQRSCAGGATPLMWAAHNGPPKALAWLLEVPQARATLQWKVTAMGFSCDGFTALHFAAWSNSSVCFRVLVDNGADEGAVDARGRTPKQVWNSGRGK